MTISDKKKLDQLLGSTGDMCLKRRAKILTTELNPQKLDKILDAGCGDGYYLYILSQLGRFNLTGIDYEKKNIENAKKQVADKQISYAVGDIQNLKVKDATFNKIILSEVLEHVESDYKALVELKRVLTKGGSIYITVPNLNYPFFWDPINYLLQRVFKTHVKAGFWAGVWNMHDRLYEYENLKKVIRKAGLKIQKTVFITHYGLPFNHYITNMGFRMRTSTSLPESFKKSISKFDYDNKKTWYTYVLSIIQLLDRRNDKLFSPEVSTVGIFIKVKKI